jgi:hypothetical protein
VNDDCRTLRLALEAGTELEGAARAHIEACGGCRAHALLLVELRGLEPGEADDAACQAILASLPVASWQRRRVATWVPLAAGLGLVGAGLALVGGPPAPSAVASLPGAVGGLAGWAGSWALDTLTVAQGGSDAARALLAAGGAWLVAWLTLAMLGGSWALHALVRRRGTDQR